MFFPREIFSTSGLIGRTLFSLVKILLYQRFDWLAFSILTKIITIIRICLYSSHKKYISNVTVSIMLEAKGLDYR